MLNLEEINRKVNAAKSEYPSLTIFSSLEWHLEAWNKLNEILVQRRNLISDLEKLEGQHSMEFLLKMIIGVYKPVTEESIPIICEAWELCKKNQEIADFVGSKYPDWVYTFYDEEECKILELQLIWKKWLDVSSRYNFYSLLTILRAFTTFGITKEAMTSLVRENGESPNLDFWQKLLEDAVESLDKDIFLQFQLDNKLLSVQDIVKRVENGDFEILFGRVKKTYENMVKAIEETEGAKEWIKEDGKYFSQSEILEKLQKQPLVKGDEHSGASFSCVLATCREIYVNGYESLVKKNLTARGIKW